MEIKYVYVKTRSQFGKQCIFDDSEVTVVENIYPNSQLMKDYIHMNPVHRGTQVSKQFAVAEVQTDSTIAKESGMHHIEGGWPKEVNARDEEAVTRYRRRIEKDNNWAPKMRGLMKSMERYILQNNAVNIYEHYFDDVFSSEIISPSVRTVNVYKDSQDVVRPITHLSWSSDNGKRLAAAYCSVEFSKILNNLSLYSYIWDIENPNKALMTLKASHPSVTIEFNSRDPSMLISGLVSGQVCNWDIRSGNTPVMISHPEFSHKFPANCALWINSKTNSEFFSASTEGTIYWWDIRMLQKPVDLLVMNLENSLQGDVVRATGVSALQYETTMGTKFMAGLENGLVINGTRKAKTTAEKIATRLECHYGPVITIDRNPFSMKNFLTVGDWSTKIWAEDTREGNLISTRQHQCILTGGCWSTSRYSVFYVINDEGTMEIFDILLGLKSPVTTTRLCEDSLKAIAPHMDGKLVAVGSGKGKIYLVESSDALTTNCPSDRTLMAAFFERCSRYEKAVDNRMKETRIAQRTVYQESESSMPLPKVKSMNKDSSRKPDKDKKFQEQKNSEEERKKLKQNKTEDIWALLGDAELADIERQYFETIEKEMEKYADAMVTTSEALEETVSIKGGSTKREKYDDLKVDEDGSKKEDSRKQRAVRESTGKDKSGRGFNTEDIVIVKQKHEVPMHIKDRGGKTVDGTDTTRRIEIMGKRVMEGKKMHEQTSEDDDNDILEIYESKKKGEKGGGTKFVRESMEKQIGEQNLCDNGICVPEICCQDRTGSSVCSGEGRETNRDSPDELEERKMTFLIEKMIAGSAKNILPTQLEHLPLYTSVEKATILNENYAPPVLLMKPLKEGKKEMQDMMKKMINTRRLVHPEHLGEIPTVIDEVDEIKDIIIEAHSVDSVTAEELESSMKTLKLNKKILAPKISDTTTESDIVECGPIVTQFGSKKIRGVIGAKITLPKLPKRISALKPNTLLEKKKNFPRISSANVNK